MLLIQTKKQIIISGIEFKYITKADYNKFTKDIVINKIKSEGLVNKSAIAEFINNADLDKKKTSSISRLKAENDKIMKLQAFHSSCFRS